MLNTLCKGVNLHPIKDRGPLLIDVPKINPVPIPLALVCFLRRKTTYLLADYLLMFSCLSGADGKYY